MRSVEHKFDPEVLDEYNIKSDARRMGRDWYDDGLDSKRQLNSFIAHYANLLVSDRVPLEGRVTTTQHNEAVIITLDRQRRPAYSQSFVLRIKEQLNWNGGKKHFVDGFRNTVISMVLQVVDSAWQIAEEENATRS